MSEDPVRPRDAAAAAAVELVEPGMTIGLGSGRAVWRVVELLGERGLRRAGRGGLRAHRRAARARRASRWSQLDGSVELDLAIDGADEVDPELRLIKGGGGALLREKIVIAAARRFVVVAEAAKSVERLGEGFRLPVEVVRFAWRGHAPAPRRRCCRTPSCAPATTASPSSPTRATYILDCALPAGRRSRRAGRGAEARARAWSSTASSSAWPSGRCWARPRAASRS